MGIISHAWYQDKARIPALQDAEALTVNIFNVYKSRCFHRHWRLAKNLWSKRRMKSANRLKLNKNWKQGRRDKLWAFERLRCRLPLLLGCVVVLEIKSRFSTYRWAVWEEKRRLGLMSALMRQLPVLHIFEGVAKESERERERVFPKACLRSRCLEKSRRTTDGLK